MCVDRADLAAFDRECLRGAEPCLQRLAFLPGNLSNKQWLHPKDDA